MAVYFRRAGEADVRSSQPLLHPRGSHGPAGRAGRNRRRFGDNGVSIASVIQKETDEEAQTAELVIMTHAAREAAVQASISHLESLEVVRQVGNFLRVED